MKHGDGKQTARTTSGGLHGADGKQVPIVPPSTPPRRVERRGEHGQGEPFRFQQYRSNFLDTDTKTRRRPISEAAARPVDIFNRKP